MFATRPSAGDRTGHAHLGPGGNDRTLTIPGNNISLNGTTVVCSAFGKINEEIVDETDSATLYIQGIRSMSFT